MHTLFKDRSIEYDFNYQPQAVPGSASTGLLYGTNVLGLADHEMHAARLREFLNSDSGVDMEAMIEEIQLYGALGELASVNPAFRDAYNENPQSAMVEYANDISATMNTIQMPKVQTVPNLYRQLLQQGR